MAKYRMQLNPLSKIETPSFDLEPEPNLLEDCDCCGRDYPIRQLKFTGRQTLCNRCNDDPVQLPQHYAV